LNRDLSLRDLVRVVFPHWVEAIFTIVDKIATQKRAKPSRFARIDSYLEGDGLTYDRDGQTIAMQPYL
jgi:hypothetical protein